MELLHDYLVITAFQDQTETSGGGIILPGVRMAIMRGRVEAAGPGCPRNGIFCKMTPEPGDVVQFMVAVGQPSPNAGSGFVVMRIGRSHYHLGREEDVVLIEKRGAFRREGNEWVQVGAPEVKPDGDTVQ